MICKILPVCLCTGGGHNSSTERAQKCSEPQHGWMGVMCMFLYCREHCFEVEASSCDWIHGEWQFVIVTTEILNLHITYKVTWAVSVVENHICD